MVKRSDILFAAAVFGTAVAGSFNFGSGAAETYSFSDSYADVCDTVIYPVSGYKEGRKGTFEDFILNDSLYAGMVFQSSAAEDTIPRLSARDTIKVPDSLRLTDPFRYKYYVALLDSATHVQVRDSLLAAKDTLSLHLLDSIYFADSTMRAKAAFAAWYASLDKDARKKYDYEQKMKLKKHELDSLNKIKEDLKAKKDSIIENTPRILETWYLPDSLWYKRIVAWNVEPDFHKMTPEVPDTSYNYYYNDYAFRRNDVNSTWLGVAGSPVQPYDFMKRGGTSGVDFFVPMESWTFSPETFRHYNTKTPYTELAYWGTLLAKQAKESDNIHILTTQNILPELNMQILYDKWGGGGMLVNEASDNRTLAASVNYTGKKYLLHTGFIHNLGVRGENGGITDEMWVRDTTVDVREVPIASTTAESQTVANTFFLEQQLRIPFTFIEKMKAAKDSTYKFNPDSLQRDITTAFIGHSTRFSSYNRFFRDKSISASDSLSLNNFDNKFFIRLQPWSEDGVVSKLNVGIGDCLKSYLEPGGSRHNENSVYLYGGVEGKFWKNAAWEATGHYWLLGNDIGSFDVDAAAAMNLYPFRRSKKSPLTLKAGFRTSLTEPNWYQKVIHTHFYDWNNDFGKISTTTVEGSISIPHWKMDATVGYNLLGNTVYYDGTGTIRQRGEAMSVLSASLRKDFTIGGLFHLDNRALFQLSSDQTVIPVPDLALNLRYYIQFIVAKDRKTHTQNAMVMQIGANALYNTPWYTPSFNSNLGVFCNQREVKYTNGPIIDAFVNIQWKRACIFIKYENAAMGWPNESRDFFSAAHYINTARGVKFGIFWPFYTQPGKHSHTHDGSSSSSEGSGNLGGGGMRSSGNHRTAMNGM